MDYLFDTYGGFFIAQKTFCLSDFFDNAPKHIMNYFTNTASLLSTIPLRLQQMTDQYDECQLAAVEKQEFVYNRNDVMYKFVSQSLRYQNNIDYLGLHKHDWIIEVIQKFNMLFIINYLFREALGMVSNKEVQGIAEEEDSITASSKDLMSKNY